MKNRIHKPELMDDPELGTKALQAALDDISKVNKILGGQQITLEGLNHFFTKFPKESYSIVDMGCGDGSMLRTIADSCRAREIHVKLRGVDLNQKSIELARIKSEQYPEIEFEVQDILSIEPHQLTCDIAISVLTLHHFSDSEIKNILGCAIRISKLGVVINDLQRSRLACVLFKAFGMLFLNTAIARYDGLISIKRGFRKKELVTFTQNLPVENYQLNWRWAFRYLWILEKQQ